MNPLEPNVDKHLRLEVFEAKFDVKDFVGALSEKLISQSKADPGPFDPKPFIRTFEAAVDKLIAVRKDVQAKTEQMEKSVRVAERDYSKKMAELNRGFEAVGQSFSGMETKMNEVGRTAIRIGEQMESVHQQRQRAQAAYDLIDFYNQFARDDTTRLDAMKKEGKDGRRKVAVLLRRLATVAKEVDLSHSDKTRENIDRYCEKFEKDMLHLFDRAYRRGDPKMMHHCAQTLLDFNGGASCVQVYVNQHDFFISRVRAEGTPNIDPHIWDTLADPDAAPPTTESGLQDLFQEIRTTVGQEAQIVQAVFPNPAFVMQVFLQRVFAQSIQQHLELLVARTTDMRELGFLRILQLVHQLTGILVEDLKAYELPSVIPRSPTDTTEFQRTLKGMSTTNTSNTATAATISTMLETAMEELFIPYTEGQRYLERESTSLGEMYADYLAKFTRYHEVTNKQGKSSMFGRMVDQLSAAAATSPSGGSSTSAQAAAALMRFGGLSSSTTQAAQNPEDPVREEDGVLSVLVAERMLKWHAEAIGRAVELSPANDAPKHTFALLRVLSAAICNSYIETALETLQARLDALDNKSEPSMQPLTVLREVNLISHLWQRYVTMALLPLASSSVTIRREMMVFNNQAVSRIEGATNQAMQKLTDGKCEAGQFELDSRTAIVNWLSAQLAKQKRTDFKPKNDDISFARVNTEPCIACCEMLEKVRDFSKASLNGKNLEVFLTEVGVAFHSLLLEHLKKFPVSATGGLMLAKDLKSYQDVTDSFAIPSLHERFEFIRQLGNVFLVRPDILKSYITEGYLGRIDASLLRPYLAQRSDWGQAEKGFNDDLGGDAGAGGDSRGGMRDRFGMGRLSMIMKDLEPLREQISMPSMPPMPALSSGFASSFANARPARFSSGLAGCTERGEVCVDG
ncbi:exocyst complex component Sec10 [Epithele typhae]|uniref:exocyst complex component Sec10 n=1 Tax=Epithele typhae TaxID=378194 RepID=UPI00200889A7|nr:exocyst complex component Sec10 [Epithele typhae]KAH9927166.1 exocyst complex component Sec10 [Epithele typhae]